MKAGVVVFPGTNCDKDTFEACLKFGWDAEYIWHDDKSPSPQRGEGWGEGAHPKKSKNLNNFDVIFLPGGFSYGDYLRSGALAKFSPVIEAIKEYIKQKRGFVVGICNGFQILCEAEILPGALTHNESLKFVCKDVKCSITTLQSNAKLPLHCGERVGVRGQNIELTLPIAHAEGRYIADEKTLQNIKQNDMIFLTYVENPNGSVENIAGLYDKENRVIGMMPHPERAFFKELGSEHGKVIFNIIKEAICG